MQYLNPVDTKITVAGKACHFVHLSLRQVFNDHHTFEIKIDYEELDSLWMNNPIQMIKMIGEEVQITMEHRQTKASNLFTGIITNVSMSGQHGEKNYIIVSGCSPTIRLSGTPTMDSFTDLTLNNIVKEVVDTSGNGASIDVKAVYKNSIDYLCQYQETGFDFINRLSWLYGEWFFYDGTTTHFGKPSTDPVEIITYDIDMTHFDLNAHLVPPKINRFEYLHHDTNEANSTAPQTVAGVRGYIKASLNESEKIYTSNATLPLKASIKSKKDLDDMVKVDKYRSVSQLLIMKGTTQTCRVRIGKIIDVKLPPKMQIPLKDVEKFIVTEVIHDIDQDGTYINTFTGVPSEMENIPMRPINAPIAQPQVAWVKSNADEKGRIKVQHQWQKSINKETNWIRVQTPDSGKSDDVAKNRGFVFIPEEGDLVMVGFENGDPNRPYVAGSVFPENESIGGMTNNKIKSITTRSGNTITFNDDENDGSITISDPSGNVAVFDGNKNITITAPETITVNAKNMIYNVEEDVKWNIGKHLVEVITESHTTTSKDTNIKVYNDMYIEVDNDQTTSIGSKLSSSAELIEHSSTGNYKIESGEKVEVKGADEIKLT